LRTTKLSRRRVARHKLSPRRAEPAGYGRWLFGDQFAKSREFLPELSLDRLAKRQERTWTSDTRSTQHDAHVAAFDANELDASTVTRERGPDRLENSLDIGGLKGLPWFGAACLVDDHGGSVTSRLVD